MNRYFRMTLQNSAKRLFSNGFAMVAISVRKKVWPRFGVTQARFWISKDRRVGGTDEKNNTNLRDVSGKKGILYGCAIYFARLWNT